jgi:small subunit ribosomal protein SAe
LALPHPFPHFSEEDVAKMLACQVHLGSRNVNVLMETYVWKRRSDGVHVFDLNKSWGQRAVLKFAQYTGAKAIAGRFTPGTFTNQITSQYLEPRLLVVTDPKMDHQPLKEASYTNIPSIAFCHSDSPTQYVDIAIPCNNKGKHAIGLMWWFLAREVLRLRDPKNFPRSKEWDVMVDLFFYRDPEEERVAEELANGDFGQEYMQGDAAEWGGAGASGDAANWEEGNWNNQPGGTDDWGGAAATAGGETNNAGWEGHGLTAPVPGWDAQE